MIKSLGRGRSSQEEDSGGDEDESDNDSDSDGGGNDNEEDDEETPLNSGKGDEKKAKFAKQETSSKLWSEDTEAQEEALRKRVMELQPLAKPIKRKKFMFQQEVMRALILLIFGHTCASFQILCVYQNQCFDLPNDPSNWNTWDNSIVPVLIVVGCVMVPFSLSLIAETNLTMLKTGAFLQFVFAVVLSIFGGIAYGEWDQEMAIKNNIRKNLMENDYEAGYSDTNMRFPAEALFYYQLTVPTPATDGEENSEIEEDTIDELTKRLLDKMGAIFACSLIGGILFLALFSFSMSYLCHVYYGPRAAGRT